MFQFRPKKCKYCRAIRGTFCYSLTLTFSTAVWRCLINGDNLHQFPVTFTLVQVVGSEMKIDLWVLLTMVHIICRGRRRRRQRRRWRFTSQLSFKDTNWSLFGTDYAAFFFPIRAARGRLLPCAEQPLPCVEKAHKHMKWSGASQLSESHWRSNTMLRLCVASSSHWTHCGCLIREVETGEGSITNTPHMASVRRHRLN